MTIERLDETRLLIALCNTDMDLFALDFDSMSLSDTHTKQVIKELLELASAKTGLNITHKSLIIEVMPHTDGCLILITIKDEYYSRKKYRIKNLCNQILYEFGNIEDFLTVVEKLFYIGSVFNSSDCYKKSDQYYLLINSTAPHPQSLALLSEYCKSYSKKATDIARIKETSTIICKNSAILTIGSAFINKNS